MDYGALKNSYRLQDLSTNTREQIVSDLSAALTPVVTGSTTITQTFVNGINLPTTVAQPNYLTFIAEQANSTIRFCHIASHSAVTTWTGSSSVEYSMDNGSTWIDYGPIVDHSGALITLSSIGDNVKFRNKTERKYGTFNAATTALTGNGIQFKMTGKLRAEGSINSLIDKNATCVSIGNYAFIYLFSGCTSLTKAPEMPATSIGSYTYYAMFKGCTGLIDAEVLLPAKYVPDRAYEQMFLGCSNLINGPFMNCDYVTSYNRYVYQNCTKLQKIGFMMANSLTTAYTASWLAGTTSTTYSPRIIYLQSGTSWNPASSVTGVPSNWTKVYI